DPKLSVVSCHGAERTPRWPGRIRASLFIVKLNARNYWNFLRQCSRTAPFITFGMKRMVRKLTKAPARSGLRVPALERRRMEMELREAEEHVALSALDALSTHIAILDGEGTIL